MKHLHSIPLLMATFFILSHSVAFGQDTRTELEQKLLQEKNRLDAVKQEISKKKETVKKVQKKERSLLSQLNEIDMELSKKREEMNKLNREITRLERKIKENNGQLTELTRRMDGQKEYLGKRIAALYKYVRSGGPVVFLSQLSQNDLIKLNKLMGVVLNNDLKTIERFNQDISSLNIYQTDLKEEEDELKINLSQAEIKGKEIKDKQDQKVALLKTIQSEKSLQLSAIKELENSSQALLDLVKRLEREVSKRGKNVPPREIRGFAMLKGKLPFPVLGKIIGFFGKSQDAELHTTIVQKGIEISAPVGADIKAIYAGRVLYADWLKGYGKIIIIDHGEGYYSLSAHTSDLLKKVGDDVKAGETIALVGDTNSLKGSCLYFEIRHHGNPQNPLEWLARSE